MDTTFLGLDKWIRHSIIAKRRRQLTVENGGLSDVEIWDRLLDLRAAVCIFQVL